MKLADTIKSLALVAVAALAACTGGGGNGSIGVMPSSPPGNPPSNPAQVTTTIVGLGDSLTAGYQSSGMLGATTVSLAAYPQFTSIGLFAVPPTQENGWFSLFYSDAKGMTWVQQATPGVSVLPLIAGPGIGNQILPANPADTGGIPFATVPGRSSCDSFNQAAFTYAANSTAGSVRMNPTSVTYDLGIPSLTLHEAISMYQPTTTTCLEIYNPPTNVAQAEIDALQALVGGESENFYPVMEKYSTPSNHVTPLAAAVSLHPTLTTVWLGANDLLKYTFSGGTAPGLDITESLVKSDMTQIIQALKHAGSDVIVATLPNVVETPQFAIVGNPPSQAYCQFQTWLPCLITEFTGLPFANSEAYLTGILIPTDSFLAPSGSQNAYLTETGLITLIASGGNPASLTAGENGTDYLTASFATQVQSVNSAINAGIVAAANANRVPYVPIDQIFDGIYSGSGAYFAAAASVNPGKCCTLAFGGGLLTFDGLHPSDSGYGFIAQAFQQAANSAFGTSIPAINPASAYSGAGGIYASYPDPYALH
ncbi:MAG TPA: SGNH/GDSL hydrolase family protein [Candidatus Tyrphobacter sp.]